MAINIESLVRDEFGKSAVDQLGSLIDQPQATIESGVESAIAEVLDGFEYMSRDDDGRQTLYEAARYCDDGLLDEPAIFFAGKDDKLEALGDSNNALGGLVGIARRESISSQVSKASGLNTANADAVTGYVTPGVLAVMKRQMLNGAVLDNPDGIGQMMLGDRVQARTGGAIDSVDHDVPQTARQTTSRAVQGAGGATAAASVASESDHSWLFRWALPVLLLGGLVLAGMKNCGMTETPVASVENNADKLMAASSELDSLRAERDELLTDRQTAVAEIDRLQAELSNVPAADDGEELAAANAEIVQLKEQLAQPADTSELDAANAEIVQLKEQLAKPVDTSDLDSANAEIVRLTTELGAKPDDSALLSLQKQLDDGGVRFAKVETELSSVRAKRDTLEASIAKLQVEKTTAEENLATAAGEWEAELAELTATRDGLTAQVETLEKTVQERESIVAERDGQIETLNTEIGTLKETVGTLTDERDSLTAERDTLTESVQSLTVERDNAMTATDEEISKVEVLNSSIGGMENELQLLITQRDGANTELESAKQAIKEVMAQNESLSAQAGEIVESNTALTTERDFLLGRVGDLETDIETSTAAFDGELAKVTKGRNAAIGTLKRLVGKLKASEAEVAARDAEVARATKGRGWALDRVSSMANNLEAARVERVKLESDNAELSQAVADAATLDAKLAKVTKGRNAAITTVKRLVGKLKASEEEVASRDAALERATKGRTWALNRVSSMTNNLEAARVERIKLEGDNAQLSQSVADAAAQAQAKKDRIISVSDSLAQELSNAGLGNVTVQPVDNFTGVGITLGSSDLYRVGSAWLSSGGNSLLDTVGGVVANYPDWHLDVEGHTDSQKIGPVLAKTYPSNWELSVARAATAVRYLQDRGGLPAERMSARGFGEHKPVADNATEAGREANRRIELILREIQ